MFGRYRDKLYNINVTIRQIDMQYKVIEFYGINETFNVNLVRKFRVLHNTPKCWEIVTSCTTPHGRYESGTTTIYQSKTTKKFYMVRYFDGCFSQMYAEVNGVDWVDLKKQISDFWSSTEQMRKEMWNRCHDGEMTYAEKNIRENRIREKAKDLLVRLVG